MADNALAVRRVVLALDSATRVEPLVEAAAALALGLRAELRAVVVQSAQLARAAALPFTRELGRASAERRAFEPPAVERMLRAQAAVVRQALDATARALQIPWGLDVVQGEMLPTLLAHFGTGDWVVIGRGASFAAPIAGRGTAGRGLAALMSRPVAVVLDGSASGDRVLDAAQAYADVAGAEIVVLVPAVSPEAFRRARLSVGEWLARRGLAAVDYLIVPGSDAVTVARAARAVRAGVLLWPGRESVRNAGGVASLLEGAGCPVVVIP
ncbi:MAG: hypothetical protein MUF79_00250 [Burkholderiales bacterium]|jgi:hypothetical protein|nr:hypothetical protein [Burkholderiales bacterium]